MMAREYVGSAGVPRDIGEGVGGMSLDNLRVSTSGWLHLTLRMDDTARGKTRGGIVHDEMNAAERA